MRTTTRILCFVMVLGPPAPAGPYFMAMRLYWSKEEALAGSWELPPLRPAE